MHSKILSLLFTAVFAFLSVLSAAETVFVPENSLLFRYDKSKNDLELKAVVQENSSGEVIKKDKIFLPQGQVIGLYADAYFLKVPGSDGLCYFPEVTFKKGRDGHFFPFADKIDFLIFFGIFIMTVGLAALAGHFCMRSEKRKWRPWLAIFA